MKDCFRKSFRFRYSTIIVIVLIVLIAICVWIYCKCFTTPVGALLGSLAAGLIVAIIQIIIAWQEYEMTEQVKDLRLIKILYDRDDRTYYENLIKESKSEIRVMGVTAKRFFEHFADMSKGARGNARVLIDALNRGVKVEILLPSKEYLNKDKQSGYEQVQQIWQKIKESYPRADITIKYFHHVPAHSIFIVDNKCIVGPVFENVESKNTPALHLENESPFAVNYIEHFDEEWKSLNG